MESICINDLVDTITCTYSGFSFYLLQVVGLLFVGITVFCFIIFMIKNLTK